jgi:hypothetical protein
MIAIKIRKLILKQIKVFIKNKEESVKTSEVSLKMHTFTEQQIVRVNKNKLRLLKRFHLLFLY